MQRVMIFAGGLTGVPAILVLETLKVLDARKDMKLVAVCTPEVPTLAGTLRNYLKDRMRDAARKLFDPIQKNSGAFPPPLVPFLLAQKHGFEWITPPEGDVNHPDFIADIDNRIRPDIALSFYWLQKFSPDLLSVFKQAVNYHNGLLPAHRGMKATAWSIYDGEGRTGFTFHRMNGKLDDGPILLAGTIPVRNGHSAADLDLVKAAAAAKSIAGLMPMLAEKHPGIEQGQGGVFHSYKDYLSMVTVGDPAVLSHKEIERRLRAFGRLKIRIANSWYDVTKVRKMTKADRPGESVLVRTSDGVDLRVWRIRYLPWGLYKIVFRCKQFVKSSADGP